MQFRIDDGFDCFMHVPYLHLCGKLTLYLSIYNVLLCTVQAHNRYWSAETTYEKKNVGTCGVRIDYSFVCPCMFYV